MLESYAKYDPGAVGPAAPMMRRSFVASGTRRDSRPASQPSSSSHRWNRPDRRASSRRACSRRPPCGRAPPPACTNQRVARGRSDRREVRGDAGVDLRDHVRPVDGGALGGAARDIGLEARDERVREPREILVRVRESRDPARRCGSVNVAVSEIAIDSLSILIAAAITSGYGDTSASPSVSTLVCSSMITALSHMSAR